MDLAAYQRDRGEWDPEARSISSSMMLDSRSMTPAPSHNRKPSGYDAYMAGGPMRQRGEEMEMANLPRVPHEDATPLLPPAQGFYGQQQQSQHSFAPSHEYDVPPPMQRFTPGNSTTSLVSGQEIYPSDPYDRRFNQTPAHGYGRPYTPSRDPSMTNLHQQHPAGNARPGGW
jgi:hypothetical protein